MSYDHTNNPQHRWSPERRKIIIDNVQLGVNFSHACALAGVDYTTYRKWMVKGEAEEEGEYRDFYDAIQAADGKSVQTAVVIWQREIQAGNWVAAKEFLSRRHPQEWGVTKVELSGPEGGPVPLQIVLPEDVSTGI